MKINTENKPATRTRITDWLPARRLERGNAADQILDELRDRILSGELPRGSKLPTEKQMAEAYGVSGATVREAIRGLTTSRLIEVRHGSGAYVTADTDQLIGLSMRSMIRLEQIGVTELLGVLGALNCYAAELASQNATVGDLEFLDQALDRINNGADSDAITQALHDFLDRIATASGNTLLPILCRFLADIQISLALQLAGGSLRQWRATTKLLHDARQRLVEKIKTRNASDARAAAEAYHQLAQKIFSAMPGAQDALVSGHDLANLGSARKTLL
jgi:DNA-binding FadR family transcriptional regulator